MDKYVKKMTVCGDDVYLCSGCPSGPCNSELEPEMFSWCGIDVKDDDEQDNETDCE